jgi:glycosyltransferase involved in cell wall biosynthesis
MKSTYRKSKQMSVELTILMPCLNEAETIETCIRKAHRGVQRAGINEYEILIADNGSSDGSQKIALRAGAHVIDVPVKGYGAALLGGIKEASGKFIIMGDSDDSYDFSNIDVFIKKLRSGYDLVMGSRLKGKIKKGAMPFLHRYLGNPILTYLGNLFFNCGFSDFHCGLRGFSREALLSLDLRTTGMEFASEMVIKATLKNLKRTEVPVSLYPDGRSRKPHLNTWQDGWRHLRFMLLYSPRWLFFYFGLGLACVGTVICLALLKGPVKIYSVEFDFHTLLAGVTMVITGSFLISMAVFVRLYASKVGLLPQNDWLENTTKKLSLELGLVIGSIVTIVGVLFYVYALVLWEKTNFGPLNYPYVIRITLLGTTFIVLGIQTFFTSFIISLLGIDTKSQ